MVEFYDTHAHVNYPDFAAELPQVLERARAAGITKVISIGTDKESSRVALDQARQHPNVYAAVGWHPSHAPEAPDDFRPLLRDLAREAGVVAIGETGLDFYRLPSKMKGAPAAEDERYKQKQRELFRQHLEVSAELGLNCVVHERDSFEAIMEVLTPFAEQVRCVFHCFAKGVPEMQRVLELGSIVSFTGILTFKSGQNVRDALAAAPAGKFMFETDSPYLAPVPYRGKRCEPAYVQEIAEAAAAIRGCSLEELSAETCETAKTFFKGL